MQTPFLSLHSIWGTGSYNKKEEAWKSGPNGQMLLARRNAKLSRILVSQPVHFQPRWLCLIYHAKSVGGRERGL